MSAAYVLLLAWQRPTLPGPCGPSTIGAGGLNGRVRDGNAWIPSAIITKRIQVAAQPCAATMFRTDLLLCASAYSLKTGYETRTRKCFFELPQIGLFGGSPKSIRCCYNASLHFWGTFLDKPSTD